MTKKTATKKSPVKKGTRKKTVVKKENSVEESQVTSEDSSTDDNAEESSMTNSGRGTKKKKRTKKTTPKKGVKKSSTKKSSPKKSSPKKSSPTRQGSAELSPYCDPDDPEIVYPVVNVLPLFDKTYNQKSGQGRLTGDQAKEFLGWQEESENISFKSEFLFKDRRGNKVRCTNNLKNRPFNSSLAWKWMIEVLRGKWRMNGETVIIDCKGMIQDGQHRLIGLVWAVQEWIDHPSKWGKYWESEPAIDVTVITGIPSDDETINTINTGKPRSFADALYRSGLFEDYSAKQRQKVARIGQNAVKLIWKRTGQKELSEAYHMPHSEAFDFIDSHPHICDSIRHIFEEDGSANKIGGYVRQGYAAALLYLMGVSASDRDVYVNERHEQYLDLKYWDKACDFWTLVANQESQVEGLLEALLKIPEEANGLLTRSFQIGYTAKAWDLFRRNKKITENNIELLTEETDMGFLRLLEYPEFGGIDIGDDSFLEKGGEVDDDEEA